MATKIELERVKIEMACYIGVYYNLAISHYHDFVQNGLNVDKALHETRKEILKKCNEVLEIKNRARE